MYPPIYNPDINNNLRVASTGGDLRDCKDKKVDKD
jgi:hypothetical protein